MTNAVYKMHIDCGQMGDVSAVFVASDEDMKNLMGKEVYFGEILGKHSNIVGIMEESDFTRITDDPLVVNLFLEHDLSTGHNPFSYLEEE